eukprot:comp20937_c0_seq1/m.43714 comp20937_c0_seq1/g.43714  ORF comp20937_c0_seq1/g.43714 comp20937_c0_seq1/m.43714 type:complete len:439 (-) comp20937_c0_seq1:26-1342(-)
MSDRPGMNFKQGFFDLVELLRSGNQPQGVFASDDGRRIGFTLSMSELSRLLSQLRMYGGKTGEFKLRSVHRQFNNIGMKTFGRVKTYQDDVSVIVYELSETIYPDDFSLLRTPKKQIWDFIEGIFSHIAKKQLERRRAHRKDSPLPAGRKGRKARNSSMSAETDSDNSNCEEDSEDNSTAGSMSADDIVPLSAKKEGRASGGGANAAGAIAAAHKFVTPPRPPRPESTNTAMHASAISTSSSSSSLLQSASKGRGPGRRGSNARKSIPATPTMSARHNAPSPVVAPEECELLMSIWSQLHSPVPCKTEDCNTFIPLGAPSPSLSAQPSFSQVPATPSANTGASDSGSDSGAGSESELLQDVKIGIKRSFTSESETELQEIARMDPKIRRTGLSMVLKSESVSVKQEKMSDEEQDAALSATQPAEQSSTEHAAPIALAF